MPYREPARRQTRYLRFCLDVLTTPSRCTFDWDLMDGESCSRSCPLCAREVHDVAAMEPAQAEEFLAERMAVPPRLALRRRPDGRVMETECPRGARAALQRRLLLAGGALVLAASGAAAFLR